MINLIRKSPTTVRLTTKDGRFAADIYNVDGMRQHMAGGALFLYRGPTLIGGINDDYVSHDFKSDAPPVIVDIEGFYPKNAEVLS